MSPCSRGEVEQLCSPACCSVFSSGSCLQLPQHRPALPCEALDLMPAPEFSLPGLAGSHTEIQNWVPGTGFWQCQRFMCHLDAVSKQAVTKKEFKIQPTTSIIKKGILNNSARKSNLKNHCFIKSIETGGGGSRGAVITDISEQQGGKTKFNEEHRHGFRRREPAPLCHSHSKTGFS